MTLRYFAQLPPTREHVAALQLLGRLACVADGSWPFALLPNALPDSRPSPATVRHVAALASNQSDGDDAGGYEPAPGVAAALELARRPMPPPSLLWADMRVALTFRPDLEGLVCMDCGAPADWVQWRPQDGEALGLCQDHIGDHVP